MRFCLLAPLLYAASTTASSITIYHATGCSGNSGECSNIAAVQCCYFTNGAAVPSAYFDIPSNAVGGTFTKSKKYDCNKNTASREGPGCVNGGSKSRGAGYNCCVGKANDALALMEQYTCTSSVAADIAVIGGHRFNMGAGVPKDDAEEFYELIVTDASYADVPEKLMKYEL